MKLSQRLLQQANKQKEIADMYAKQNRNLEQQYHFGRYTGLRDAATQIEIENGETCVHEWKYQTNFRRIFSFGSRKCKKCGKFEL